MESIRHIRCSRSLAFGLTVMALTILTGCGAAGGGGGGGAPAGDGNGDDDPGNGNPPAIVTADAGAENQSITLSAGRAATVTLDGSGSGSPNGAIVSYEWSDAACGALATGATPEVELGIGEHLITLTVADATGASDETTVAFTVVDNRPDQFTLTTAATGNGTTIPAPGTWTYNRDSTATVTAIPDDGWQFAGWTGDDDSTLGTTTVVMAADLDLTAVFEEAAARSVPQFKLPWSPGETKTFGQANNGEFSHVDRFAWDIGGDIGTPILSAGAGRVIQVTEDLPNNPEGVTGDPDDPANAIQIDHGNGVQSLYAHLDQFGAAVVPGQLVAAGQYLGRIGNSGYGTGPHLHYEVLDATGSSVSTGFDESGRTDGIAEEEDYLTSQNWLDPDSLDGFAESTLPLDAFTDNDVELFDPAPPAFFYVAGETYSLSGQVTGPATGVCAAFVHPETGETAACDVESVGLDRRFDYEFTVPEDLSGTYFLGVVSGVGGVSGLAPVTVQVFPPAPDNTAPTVSVAQPADATIDFGASGQLIGAASDADGDTLTYLWSQTSGPLADIADSGARETSFTLTEGLGHTRVAFQFIAFDGAEWSAPAEVAFEMPDNFAVREIGVTDQECDSPDTCPAVSGGSISTESTRLTVWIRVANIHAGDESSFEIRSLDGETQLSGPFCEPSTNDTSSSFWRYSWSRSNGGVLDPGQWQAVYIRNGIVEGSTTFTVGS